jgi:choline dehydrogenase-like flavoprotein
VRHDFDWLVIGSGFGGSVSALRLAEEIGVGETYAKTRVGVFLGAPGETVSDPFFGGTGPDRTGCLRCGRCMIGCPHGAKNTLVKNYLWFAEREGAQVMPGRTVVDIAPLGAPDGSDGYAVTSERSGAWLRKDRRTQTARGVVVAAGALGTNRLLAACRLNGSNIPSTAHILGGAVIGASPETGVLDARQRVFGYEHLLVCDGAAIPANVGVNPSLTITALAEHAMSRLEVA